MKNDFQPDYTNLLKVLYNQRPDYLPLYEHNIDEPFIAKMLGREVDSTGKSGADLEEHYRVVTEFWRANTYDALSYEAKICEIYPDHGAILGGRLGPIQTRADFDRYPWEEIPRIFIRAYKPHLDALRKVMPRGMKAYGGCGYGIFESAEDLVGYESLCMMQFLDPDLFRDLFVRIGDLYEVLWTWVLDNYADLFVFCRMGDDLGYRTSTMLAPDTIREHILPQHRRVIDLVHSRGKKFLLHSCGNIFSIMEDILANGIDAKHSNEDQIAPFSEWIDRYGDRIGLVAFAAEAFTQSPLTTDQSTLQTLLAQIRSGLIDDSGTAIGNGLATAINRLRESDAKSKVVILLTDGVNNRGEITPITAAEIAKAQNIRVYTIGVGTEGMAPYPAVDMFGNITFVKQKVEIDEKTLTAMAEMTGGRYFRATDNAKLKAIYDEINQLEKSKVEVTEHLSYHEQFLAWVLAALGLLLAEFLLANLVLKRIP